jgi:hypothetical protein
VRYWFGGEDEDYEKERERVTRFGGDPPAPVSFVLSAGVVLLVITHTTAISLLILVLTLWLR